MGHGVRAGGIERRAARRALAAAGLAALVLVGLAPTVPQAASAAPIVLAQPPTASAEPGAISFVQPVESSLSRRTLPGTVANGILEVPSVATGDLNGDDIPDLVATYFRETDGQNGGVAVMRGIGDGTFEDPKASFLPAPYHYRTKGVAVGDFDEDGDEDVVTTTDARKEVQFWANDGTGTLAEPIFTPSTQQPGVELTTGDVDGDDHLDLVAISPGTSAVVAYFGDGDGAFSEVALTAPGDTPTSIVATDLDGDGDVDLGASSYDRGLLIFRNDGARTFTLDRRPSPVGMQLSHLWAGDVNGDQDVDLVVGGFFAGSPAECFSCVLTLLGDGVGGFAVPTTKERFLPVDTTTPGGPTTPMADLDGDGDLDAVLVMTTSRSSVTVLLNDGTGAFAATEWVAITDDSGDRMPIPDNNGINNGTRRNLTGLAVADLDADGVLDLAVSGTQINSNDGGVTILPSDTARPGRYITPEVLRTPGPDPDGGSIAVVDWDGDDHADIVNPTTDGRIWYLPGNGDGSFRPRVAVTSPVDTWCYGSRSMTPADLDGDGNADLICRGTGNPIRISVLYGDGAGAIAAVGRMDEAQDLGYAGQGPVLGDIDGDGDLDAVAFGRANVCCDPPNTYIGVYTNGGVDRAWTREVLTAGKGGSPLALSDVDGDDDLDLVTQPTNDGTRDVEVIDIRRNDGTGTFGEPERQDAPGIQAYPQPHSFNVLDVDHDGDEDLIAQLSTFRGQPGAAMVLRNDGTGDYAAPVRYPSSMGGGELRDLDGDGEPDLALASAGFGVEVLRNAGDGTFERYQRFSIGTMGPYALGFGDVDGDDDLDVVTARSTFGNGDQNANASLTVLLNTSTGVVAPDPPDLEVASISAPASVEPGTTASVEVEVRNTGGTATGSWTDQVWLSDDDTWSLDDRLLGSATRSAPVPGGGSYTLRLDPRWDPLLDGDHRVIVKLDARRQLDESDEADDVAMAPDPVLLDVPELALDAPTGVDLAAGDVRYLRIADPSQALQLLAESGVGDVADVEVVRGAVPRPRQQLVVPDPSAIRRSIALPDDAAGDWYLRLAGRAGAGGGRTLTLTATPLDLGVFSSSPTRGSTLGTTTVRLTGAGFRGTARVRLVDGPGGAESGWATAAIEGPGALTAPLLLRGVPLGRYDLEVVRGDGTSARLGDAFTVSDADAGEIELYVLSPARIRPGWTGEHVVTIRNTGATDLTIDGLEVAAERASLRLPGRTSFSERPVRFEPADPPGPYGPVPAGVIPPGGVRRAVVELTATGANPKVSTRLFEADRPVEPPAPPEGLVVEQVQGQGSATAGDDVQVSFRLRNAGDAALAGPWTFEAGVVGEPTLLDGAVVGLPPTSEPTELTVGAGLVLDPGEEEIVTGRAVVGDVPDGTYRWLVVWPGADPGVLTETDDLEVVADLGADPPDDAAGWSFAAVAISARSLPLDAPTEVVLAAGETRLLRLEAGDGPVRVAAEATAAVDVAVAAGRPPVPGDADDVATVQPGTPASLALQATDDADYVLVGPADGPATVTLEATSVDAGIRTLAPSAGGNAGSVTVAIDGDGLGEVAGVELVAADATRRAATRWSVIDESTAVATFDLTGLTPGDGQIELSLDGGGTFTAPFTVLDGGTAALETDLDPPDRMRFGVPNPVVVRYRNTGTIDLPLPFLTVAARDGGTIGVITGRTDADADVTFVPPSPVAGAGEIPPGAEGEVTLWYTPPDDAPDDVTFDLWATDGRDPAFADDPVDWDQVSADVRPDGVSDADWDAHLAEERARYGETYGDLLAYIAGEYRELAAIGMDRSVYADGEWQFFARSVGSGTALRHGGTATEAPDLARLASIGTPAGPARVAQTAEGDGIQNVRAVVIGNPDGSLNGAKADAQQFATLLTKTYNLPKKNVTTLYEGTTTAQAKAAIAKAQTGMDADDLLLVTVATHGEFNSKDPTNPDEAYNAFGDGRMTATDWNQSLSNVPGKALLILDTCKSSNITDKITAPNVTTLASSDYGQAVPDRSYTQVLIRELQADPRGSFYAAAQRAGDYQLENSTQGPPTDAGRALLSAWRGNTIDRPADGSAEALLKIQAKLREDGVDLSKTSAGENPKARPLYPTLDRRGNVSLSIDPPDPKKSSTSSGGKKQKQKPPTKTKKTKVDADDPKKKPSEEPGKEGEPVDPKKNRGEPDEELESTISTVQSGDPNEIVGPAGVGDARWVAGEQVLGYEVRFENLGPASTTIPPGQSIATAPAALVDITTTLDPDADLGTFALGEFGIGTGDTSSGYPTVRFRPTPGSQAWSQDIPITVPVYGTDEPPVDLILRGEAALDPVSRQVRWTLTALDPETGALPADGLVGFLPPEDGTHAGQGFARYEVGSSTAAASLAVTAGAGTSAADGTLAATARIVFDANAPIDTNTWSNGLDAAAPTAGVGALPATSTSPIPVSWLGGDAGAGVATFDVYVSVDGGPLNLWLDDTTATSGSFPGAVGERYGFAVRATDAVGHRGAVPTEAETETLVVDSTTTTTTSTTTTTTTSSTSTTTPGSTTTTGSASSSSTSTTAAGSPSTTAVDGGTGGTGGSGGGSGGADGSLPFTGSDLRLALLGLALLGVGAAVLASRRRAARSA